MQELYSHFHTFILCLLRPRVMLDWMRYGISPEQNSDLPRPELTSQIALSWSLAAVQAIARLMIANLIVQLFIHFQNNNDYFFGLIETEDGLLPYYIMLFSTTLDLIFFPILTLVATEFWNLVLRLYASLLDVEEDTDDVARDITTVALSSNFFLVLPVIGVVFRQISWLYLLYVGCRHRMGASRALSVVILVTPTVVMLMGISLISLVVFYLFMS
ncbi:MAG: hypothetical protein K2P81_02730 [Bacteriovoracaceae bacterium]|nr:hypothetical protein [Bacteriovoracaceae bacterium]